jgi:hypothetical protein
VTMGVLAWYNESTPVFGLVLSTIFLACYPVFRSIWDIIFTR